MTVVKMLVESDDEAPATAADESRYRQTDNLVTDVSAETALPVPQPFRP